jgi:hypothetical protein
MGRRVVGQVALAVLAILFSVGVSPATARARGALAVPVGIRDCLGPMVCDPALGVDLVLPAGWSAAPRGQ